MTFKADGKEVIAIHYDSYHGRWSCVVGKVVLYDEDCEAYTVETQGACVLVDKDDAYPLDNTSIITAFWRMVDLTKKGE